jgi:hypothetical protein
VNPCRHWRHDEASRTGAPDIGVTVPRGATYSADAPDPRTTSNSHPHGRDPTAHAEESDRDTSRNARSRSQPSTPNAYVDAYDANRKQVSCELIFRGEVFALTGVVGECSIAIAPPRH